MHLHHSPIPELVVQLINAALFVGPTSARVAGLWGPLGWGEGQDSASTPSKCSKKIPWWQLKYLFHFHPYLGMIPNLIHIFQRGWNHQLECVSWILWIWLCHTARSSETFNLEMFGREAINLVEGVEKKSHDQINFFQGPRPQSVTIPTLRNVKSAQIFRTVWWFQVAFYWVPLTFRKIHDVKVFRVTRLTSNDLCTLRLKYSTIAGDLYA